MTIEPAPPPAVTLAEVKAYLRIETTDEDALLERLIGAATGACEDFLRRQLISREGVESPPAMAAYPADLPLEIRQGIIGLVAHIHAHRDDAGPAPASIAVLWRPWRRMRLI